MSRIFVNYRRADAAAHANLLYDWLRERYGEQHVFKDVETIEPGLDFVEAIDRAVATSHVMLVVIGREWVVDADGRRRLEEPDDYVAMEVASALRRNIRVIPVLVEGATMPTAADLPEALAALTRRHAFELSDGRSRIDREELLRRLDLIVGTPAHGNRTATAALRVQPQAAAPVVAAPVVAAAPAPARTVRERTKGLVKWGWIFAGGSVLVPFLAVVSVVMGALVISRSSGERTGTGIGLILGALVVAFFSLSFWMEAATY